MKNEKYEILNELYKNFEKEYCRITKSEGFISVVSFVPSANISKHDEETIVDGIYDNADIWAMCQNDVRQYHFMLLSICLENGLCAALLAEESPDIMSQENSIAMFSRPNPFFARSHIMNKYSKNDYEYSAYCSSLFDKHCSLMKKYQPKSQDDVNNAVRASLLAAFRLGVTIGQDK